MILLGDSGGSDQTVDAQADLGLCCPHMPKDTLLNVIAQMYFHVALHISEKFVCVEVLRPSQSNGVMSSRVSLPNHTFTGQA